MLVVADLFGQRLIVGRQHKAPAVARQTQASVARSVVADLHGHVLRHVVLGELVQRLDDLGRFYSRGTGIPDRQRRNPVRVDVLGRLDQLGKPSQRIAGGHIMRAVHFHQHGVVALDDQRVFRVECGASCKYYRRLTSLGLGVAWRHDGRCNNRRGRDLPAMIHSARQFVQPL